MTQLVRTQLSYDAVFLRLTYFAWCSLALLLFISTRAPDLYFIFMLPPGFYYTYHHFKDSFRQNHKNQMPKSAWALLVTGLFILVSQLINSPEISSLTFEKLVRGRYLITAFLAIVPTYQLITSSYFSTQKKHILWGLLLSSALLANSYGFLTWLIKDDLLSLLLPSALDIQPCKDLAYGKSCGLYNGSAKYAGILQLFALISLGLTLYHKKNLGLWRRSFMLFSTIISVLALYATYSRSALFAFLLTYPLVFMDYKKKLTYALCLGSILIASLWIALVYFQSIDKYYYTISFKSHNNLSRISLYQAALGAFKERPFRGIGYKNFKEKSLELQKKYSTIKKNQRSISKHHAHNSFLEMLVGCGIFGFLALVAFCFLWLKEVFFSQGLRGLFLPSLIVFLLTAQVHGNFIERTTIFFAMAMYIFFQAIRLKKLNTTDQS